MSDDVRDSVVSAIAFAESLFRKYAEDGRNPIDLFAAFVGIVVEQDEFIGLTALRATDLWISKNSKPSASVK
jgi:hypothetical protein